MQFVQALAMVGGQELDAVWTELLSSGARIGSAAAGLLAMSASHETSSGRDAAPAPEAENAQDEGAAEPASAPEPQLDGGAGEAPRRIGCVEGARHGQLTGWAYDAPDPDRRAAILVGTNQGQCLPILADHYRADVQAAGYGDGYAGFSVPTWCLGDADEVACTWADTGEHLSGSPLKLTPGARAEVETGPGREANARWIVLVDASGPKDRALSGYFMDLADPERRPVLNLECDGQTIGQARACLFHPGAPGDRMHGFRFLLGAPLPHRPCTIRDSARDVVLLTFEGPAA